MQRRMATSPHVGAERDSAGRSGASAQLAAQAHGTNLANPTVPPGRIELRKVYRLSLFASRTAED